MKHHQVQLVARIPIFDKQGKKTGERQVATYQGLLARAHEDGLRSITTELVQTPTRDNGQTAIVRAVVTTGRGVYCGIGDASPANVNARVAAHLLRMAETRAKARALRDATNIGVLALEELEDVDEAAPPVEPEPTARTPEAAARERALASAPRRDSSRATEAQRRAVFRLATARGIAPEHVPSWLHSQFGVDAKKLGKADASRIIDDLQKSNGSGPETRP